MIQLILSLVAIGFLAILSLWLGQMRTAPLDSIQTVKARLSKVDPEFRSDRIFLSDDKQAALAFDDGKAGLALVRAIGDHYSVRTFGHGDLLEVSSPRTSADPVVLRTKDATFPRLRFRTKDEQLKNEVAQRLEPFVAVKRVPS